MNDITLSSSAVLVDLTIRGWTGKKLDKDVSNEIDAAKATQVKAGAYQKNLLAGSEQLASVNQYAMMIRAWHAKVTLPWSDSGTRLLPTSSLQRYMQELSDHEVEYRARVSDFQQAYTTLIQAAQFRLGQLFKLSDYPDPSEIPGKFELRTAMYPLPEAGDFRVDIGNAGLAELRATYQEQQQKRIQEAVDDVRDRVKTALQKISNQLRIEPDGTKGRMHEVTLENAIELCNDLNGFNLTRDPELDRLKKEMHDILMGVDIKEMKRDEFLRRQAKQDVDALLDKFNFN